MKKILCIVLALMMVLSLAACGGAKTETPKTEEPKTEAPKAEAPKAEAPKAEEPKAEAPKAEEPKAEEPKAPTYADLKYDGPAQDFVVNFTSAEQQNPIYIQIATSLECVFSADFSVMSQMFTSYLAGDSSSWELRLVPKSKSVASFMESIEMKGSDRFESLTLYETTGDSIRYEFSGLENRELTDEELKVYSL